MKLYAHLLLFELGIYNFLLFPIGLSRFLDWFHFICSIIWALCFFFFFFLLPSKCVWLYWIVTISNFNNAWAILLDYNVSCSPKRFLECCLHAHQSMLWNYEIFGSLSNFSLLFYVVSYPISMMLFGVVVIDIVVMSITIVKKTLVNLLNLPLLLWWSQHYCKMWV